MNHENIRNTTSIYSQTLCTEALEKLKHNKAAPRAKKETPENSARKFPGWQVKSRFDLSFWSIGFTIRKYIICIGEMRAARLSVT